MRTLCLSLLLGLVCLSTGCAEPSDAQPAPPPRASESPSASVVRPGVLRSNVATPVVTLLPAEVSVAPGAKVTLTAKPGGGEAMRFTVDWRVDEGAVGGSVESVNAPQADGSHVAVYTAPSAGEGSFHVTVKLHEYPNATATTMVTVVRKRP